MVRKIIAGLILVFPLSFIHAQDSLMILDVRQCVDIALENNLALRRSQLFKENSQINFNQARASQLPTLNLSGGYNVNFGRSIDPTTNQFIAQQINALGFSGSSNLTIFNGLRLTNSVRQSKIDLEAAGYDVDKAINDISLTILNAYLTVIFNQELLENAKYQLESSQKQLDRTKILVSSGALPRTNELELESQVASNEVALINAQNNLDLALLNLKQGMMIPSAQEIEILIPEIDVEEVALDVTIEEVYNNSLQALPEIESARLNVESAQMGVRIAKAGYIPTLSASAGFRTNYSGAVDRPSPIYEGTEPVPIGNVNNDPSLVVYVEQPRVVGEDPSYTVSEQFESNLSQYIQVGLSIPVFNGLQAKSNVQRSRISLQQAEIDLLDQKNQLRQTIETAYNNALAASKTYSASLKQVEALEETFRSVENQYNLGASNFTDYQVASNNLYQAKSDLVRAKFDFVFKKKLVDFYQGKPLEF